VVIAGENRLTCELLSQDLKALVEDNWDWQVKRLSDTDFSVVCPTKASLTLCKNLCRNAGGIALPISKVSVLFADPQPHPRASAILSKIWVWLSEVPPCLRKADLLLEGTKMLGRPRMMDEDSLADDAGPVRMLFHSHAPDRLPKSVLLFANLRGFRIGVSVELAKEAVVVQMGEPSKKDDGDRNDEDKAQTEDQSQSDCHWKRRSGKDKEKVVDPNILKRSKMSAADRAEVGWESPENWDYDSETLAEKIAKLKRKQDGEVDNPPASAPKMDLAKEVAASSQVSKAKRSVAVVSPISGSRSSARARGSEAEPILQKAIKRAAAKSGMSPPPISQLLAFSSMLDLHFMGVAGDCGLVLGEGFSSPSPSSLLSVIRAKEIAQAKLAEAIEVAAQQARQQASDNVAAPPTEEPTSVVGTLVPLSQEVPPDEEIGNPDDILVVSLKRQKTKKAPRVALPPRTNLRATPARQA
jgi:hypothetical protein